MLTVACDASGDDATPVLSVAGFISSVKDWETFSELWTERLSREGIKYCRAVEAAHFNGEFKPWKKWSKDEREAWRQALFSDLMALIQRNTYRHFSTSIVNRAFSQMNESLREQ